jgi:uncharacterized protein (AIM24 family)
MKGYEMKTQLVISHMDDVGSVAGVGYQVQGELTPVLMIELSSGASVFYEHHVLLTKDPDLKFARLKLQGALKRMVAGLPLILVSAIGPGHIAFSREHPGHVFAIHLKQGQKLLVPEHVLLAATGNIRYDFEWVKGFFRNQILGGNGMFIDRFTCTEGDGAVWLHGHGNVLEYQLEAGERIDVEPGAWIYRDPSVSMQTAAMNLSLGIFSGGSLWYNRFTGPGRLGVQTGYWEPTSSGS